MKRSYIAMAALLAPGGSTAQRQATNPSADDMGRKSSHCKVGWSIFTQSDRCRAVAGRPVPALASGAAASMNEAAITSVRGAHAPDTAPDTGCRAASARWRGRLSPVASARRRVSP